MNVLIGEQFLQGTLLKTLLCKIKGVLYILYEHIVTTYQTMLVLSGVDSIILLIRPLKDRQLTVQPRQEDI